VEEHFYILLPLFLLLLIRFSPDREDPFQVIPWAFLVVAATCLSFRIATVLRIPRADLPDWTVFREAYATTHCRMDSLFFGVLLGYLHHFRPELLERLVRPSKNRIALVFLSVASLSCCLFLPIHNRFMLTAGLTLLYLGFGSVLMLCLHVRGVLPRGPAKLFKGMGKGLAYVGMYSYSVYLWHTSFLGWGPGFVKHVFHTRLNAVTGLAFYFIGSVTFGILMSRLIEYPVLRMRDKILPAMQESPPKAAAPEVNEISGPAEIRNVV
jgi:peptidoglycan/LPS O-acetylase OafA/YrhL